MKIKFCGAASGHVTGSSHLLELDNGFKILLDCGLYQGDEDELPGYNESWLFDPKSVDAMILTHAHIDHAGRIPKLVKDGFEGSIYTTSATRDLSAIMLLDSAMIQEKEADYANKKKGIDEPLEEALYTATDVEIALNQFISVSYNNWIEIHPSVQLFFQDAGHILGSASITLKVNENGQEKFFGFTGDIGRPGRPILKDPEPMLAVDYLICESTYGGKVHQGTPADVEELLDIINETCIKNKGKLLIPAFSVGRTQEFVYLLDQLERSGKLPKIKVFVDSPLATNATDVFRQHPECFDSQISQYMIKDPNPFGFENLKFVRDAEDSKKLNALKDPCIIIASSGMMNAGRIRHHIANNIQNPNNTLLILGYCSPNTLGGKLLNGVKEIKLFGSFLEVKAKIVKMSSMSAHGDEQEMVDFLKYQDKAKLMRIFLVHGEQEERLAFKSRLEKEGFKSIILPEIGEIIELG